MAPVLPMLPYLAMAGAAGYSAYSANKNKAEPPNMVARKPDPVNGRDTQAARDDVLRRLARLRSANNAREGALSTPNIKRRTLGAGA